MSCGGLFRWRRDVQGDEVGPDEGEGEDDEEHFRNVYLTGSEQNPPPPPTMETGAKVELTTFDPFTIGQW